jgi:hypothetical protein
MSDATPPAPRMRHRSYYLAADVADQLAEAVDDLHFATRAPKHVVLSAVVAVALAHRAEVVAALAGGPGDAAAQP